MSRALCVLWLALMVAVFVLPTTSGDDVTRRTVRVALLYYALAGVLMIRGHRAARACWTLAWLAYVIHVGVAFRDWHHWSHAEAVAHVEGRSGFGPGLYFSYLFTLLWSVDVLWWWLAPINRANRRWWVSAMLHGYMGFIVFNATVVFETGLVRWFGAGMFVVFGVAWWRWRVMGGRRARLVGGDP